MDIQKIGVVGCGLMGSQIAQVCAQAGYQTIVREPTEELLQKGLDRISAFLDKGVAKKKLSPAKREATWANISGTTDLKDFADCDLVIEAIVEIMDVKLKVFEELDGICKEEAILASNTSSLSIAEMAGATKRPDRVAGLHFFFPAVINQLVEVVVAEQTSDEVRDTLLEYCRLAAKIPIVVRDAPGFAVNRFFVPWLNEAARLLDEDVANVATIDAAAREAFSIGMGPFALMNATGVPIAYHSAVSLGRGLGEFYQPAESLKKQFEAGQEWVLDGEVVESAKQAVKDRLLGVVFGVAAALVEEGVATAEDTDLGAMVGLRWARGPFGLMNEVGLDRALYLVERLAAESRARFEVPELLKKQAASGQPWTLRDVKLTVDGPIATILMNRPQAMNALNDKVMQELWEAVVAVRDNPDVRVCIITGAGTAFVAGADIKTMAAKSLVDIRTFTYFGQKVLKEIENMEKPFIAAINGFALGGGFELALACDIRLASTEASVGFPEVGLGIYPGLGGTQRTVKLVGKGKACELIFTGDIISAEEAERVGLINRAVPARELMRTVRRMANKIASKAPLAVGRAKSAINKALQTGLDVGLAYEVEGVVTCFGTEDKVEGMAAFVERRRPVFKGR